MFLLDIRMSLWPTGADLAGKSGLETNWANIILTDLAINYFLNLFLAVVVILLVKKSLKENKIKLLLVVGGTTAAMYAIEALEGFSRVTDFSYGFFSTIAIFVVYYFIFNKEFELTTNQAVAGALAFAIITTPFYNFYFAEEYQNSRILRPHVATTDTLKRVLSMGYGFEVRDRVVFSAGTTLTKIDVVAELPISDSSVYFSCADESVCGKQGTISISEDKITANKKITASIGACVGEEQKYFLIISSSGNTGRTLNYEKAREVCKIS
ncbi:MAG: hypothetical protein V1817_00980 [Candidatus Micrarchaeota archaeon]